MKLNSIIKKKKAISSQDKFFTATQYQLMWRKFKKHKPSVVSGIFLIFLYIILAIGCEFFAPYNIYKRHSKYVYAPPQRIHFFDEEGNFHLRPFVYGLKKTRDPETFRISYKIEKDKKYPLYFFVRGDKYELWNLFESDLHFFGVKKGVVFLFGTEGLGRDMLSRTLYGGRISLSIGLVGVAISFILGCIMGGISGYYGGVADLAMQRVIEILITIPAIPLWMGLSAALPPHWSPIKVYFGIIVILSITGWCGLARVVRGKLLELKQEDFSLAAKVAGASDGWIISRHLLPSFLSYLIVNLTLAIPIMILGETALSFLGIGLRPPVVSWGVLLKQAQNVETLGIHPWFLIPALFVIATVLAFNFLGDGLRDAADPYK